MNKELLQSDAEAALSNLLFQLNSQAGSSMIPWEIEDALEEYHAAISQPEQVLQQVVDIDDLVFEFEAMPGGVDSMIKGRQWVKEVSAQPEQTTAKWVEAAYSLYLLEADDGEVLESIRTSSYDGTATVAGSNKTYTTLAAAKSAVRAISKPGCPTSADFAKGYAEGFNDACKPSSQPVPPATPQPTQGDAKDALNQAAIGLAALLDGQSNPVKPTIHEYGQASRALIAVRAAIASQKGTI